MNDLLEPWGPLSLERQKSLEAELARELHADHVLAGRSLRAVAARADQDDVLFEVDGIGFAVVHLTWSGRRESSAQWPSSQLFPSLEDWRERGMKADHENRSSRD
jgi:hypothetical protein